MSGTHKPLQQIDKRWRFLPSATSIYKSIGRTDIYNHKLRPSELTLDNHRCMKEIQLGGRCSSLHLKCGSCTLKKRGPVTKSPWHKHTTYYFLGLCPPLSTPSTYGVFIIYSVEMRWWYLRGISVHFGSNSFRSLFGEVKCTKYKITQLE